MNNKLILRTLTSPFITPYADITKDSVLSRADVDNNFIYLKGETIYSAETTFNTVILKKLNGNDLSFDLIPQSGGTINNVENIGNGVGIFNSLTSGNTVIQLNSITGTSNDKIAVSVTASAGTINLDINEQNLTLWPLVVNGNQLLSGGASYLSGLTFNVTNLSYIIDGTIYSANASTVIVASGDTTFDRIDVIVADISGNTSVVQGTPSADPVKPDINESSQIEVTFVTIAAGASTIPLTYTLVYDEKIGPPTEWLFTTPSSPLISGDSTAQSYTGTKSIQLTGATNAKSFTLSSSTIFDSTTQNTIQFAIKNKIAWPAGTRLRITILSSTGIQIGTFVDLYNARFGFSSANISTWQLLSIPLSYFALTTTLFSQIKVLTVNTGTAKISCFIDYIRMVEGIPSVTPNPAWLNIKVDNGTSIPALVANDTLTLSGGTNIGARIVGPRTIVFDLDGNINLTGITTTTISATTYLNLPISTGSTSGGFTGWTGSTGISSIRANNGTTLANGDYSISEGQFTTAIGTASHAEGSGTTASGNYSHSEGYNSTTIGSYSHSEGNGSLANGDNSHAEGSLSTASGIASHVEGYNTTTTANFSHAEGLQTTASGSISHAEGAATIALGARSHAQNSATQALGDYSHSEGNITTASGSQSHAEGYNSIASGTTSHAEGDQTIASDAAHSEGTSTTALGFGSHAEGESTVTNGQSSHAEGSGTTANGSHSHSEGYGTTAQGDYSHAEGNQTIASGATSHAEGYRTITKGDRSHIEGTGNFIGVARATHAEGNFTVVGAKKQVLYDTGSGIFYNATTKQMFVLPDFTSIFTTGSTIFWGHSDNLAVYESTVSSIVYTGGFTTITIASDPTGGVNDVFTYELGFVVYNIDPSSYPSAAHAEGMETVAYGQQSHAEGYYSEAIANQSHAEGRATTTLGVGSHSEGQFTTAQGTNSHSEGVSTTASGINSHAEGHNTIASGNTSHAEGYRTTASGDYSHAQGQGTKALGTTSVAMGNGSIADGGVTINYTPSAITVTSAVTITTSDPNNALFAVVLPGDVSIEWTDYYGLYCSLFTLYGGTASTMTIDCSTLSDLYYDSGSNSTYIVDSTIIDNSFTFISGNTFVLVPTSTTRYPAFAFGQNVQALGNYSYAEGNQTIASGTTSHAEGFNTTAIGDNSHSEGQYTITIGSYGSHAEGYQTIASGVTSHAEGYLTIAGGDNGSHAEGQQTKALGSTSHAEGVSTTASGDYSHSEGNSTKASGFISHAEGNGTTASGSTSHAEGVQTIAGGIYSHAEGYQTTASGNTSHAQNNFTIAGGDSSHAEGATTQALGDYSHAEGSNTKASGQSSHAEGASTTANGLQSHAEGVQTTSSGTASHAEGGFVQGGSHGSLASGNYSHAQNANTTASGLYSHAGGLNSIASGITSFVHGSGSTAGGTGTVVLGNGITGLTSNTIYVPEIVIKKSAAVPTSSADTIGENGSITWDNTYLYYKSNNQWKRLSGSTF